MVKKEIMLSSRKIIIIFFLLFIISIIVYNSFNKIDSTKIEQLTDLWIYNVTQKNDSNSIAQMFCDNGNLVGTVSQIKRQGIDIKKYFDYFAKLPEIKVVDKKYDITEVVPNVYINTALITWSWKGLDNPIVARMTFLFKNKCIFQLHSSALPDLNQDLKNISGLA